MVIAMNRTGEGAVPKVNHGVTPILRGYNIREVRGVIGRVESYGTEASEEAGKGRNMSTPSSKTYKF